jgi:hypothetical protein
MKAGYGNGGDLRGTEVVPFTGFSSCLHTGVELRQIRGLLTQLEYMVGEESRWPPGRQTPTTSSLRYVSVPGSPHFGL